MRLIICEGKHACNALQGLLESAFGCKIVQNGSRPSWFSPRAGSGETLREFRSSGGETIFVFVAGGKTKVLEALRLRAGPAQLPGVDRLAVCFDPDAQTPSQWLQMIRARLPPGALPSTIGFDVPSSTGSISVLPIPFRSPTGGTAESLYSVITSSLGSISPARATEISGWMQAAGRHGASAAANPNKVECWFWMAAWHFDAECEWFFSEVLRDPTVHAVLQGSPASATWWQPLSVVAG